MDQVNPLLWEGTQIEREGERGQGHTVKQFNSRVVNKKSDNNKNRGR